VPPVIGQFTVYDTLTVAVPAAAQPNPNMDVPGLTVPLTVAVAICGGVLLSLT
jgi:hypothetical protein